MGGGGKIVESDETYFKGGRTIKIETLPGGRKIPVVEPRYYKVMALVERSGKSRAFHMGAFTSKSIRNVLVTKAILPTRGIEIDLFWRDLDVVGLVFIH